MNQGIQQRTLTPASGAGEGFPSYAMGKRIGKMKLGAGGYTRYVRRKYNAWLRRRGFQPDTWSNHNDCFVGGDS